MIKQVSVFCASSNKVKQEFYKATRDTGEILARENITVFYGGGTDGLMGELANTIIREKGKIIGIQPQFMKDSKWFHEKITKLIIANDMHERKKLLFENSDAIIALPGGIGTLDELVEIITLKQLGQYLKPVIIINTNGFYDPFIRFLDNLIQENFMRELHREIWTVIDNPNQLMDTLKNTPSWDPNNLSLAQI
ncbi:MAG: TIGR00730 family Rossman fold protein [Bacteroidales bacterium]